MPFTIADAKELGESYQPIHLWLFTWASGDTLAVCTHALTYDSVDYEALVLQEKIDPIQAMTPQGIEVPPSVRLNLADANKVLYGLEVARKFRGARLTLRFLYRDFAGAAWSTDSTVPFLGKCEKPEVLDGELVVQARHILNLEAKRLPSARIQARCWKLFPFTASMKALASTPRSLYYACGVTDVSKVSCDFDLAACTANGVPLRFGGTTHELPPASGPTREYTSGNWITDLQTDPNAAKYGDVAPIGYGTAWVDCKGLGAWPQADSTRGEVIVCEGRPAAIYKVLVNDEELPPANALDGSVYIVQDKVFRYNVVSTGDRDGALNTDIPWNGAGDPAGSFCKLQWTVPKRVTQTQPRVRALIEFPKVLKYAKISAIVAGVATLADSAPNTDIAGGSPFTVTIFGNSNGALNATFGLTSWASGPPGTVTLTGTSASGTGGYIAYEASSNEYAWAILDVLQRTGLIASTDVDFDAWIAASNLHKQVVDFTARDGTAGTHAKFTIGMAITTQRTVAELVAGMLRGCHSQLGRNPVTGKIALYARATLAQQQPAAVAGSNDNTITDGGYLAYHFDESTMVRDESKMTRAGAGGSVPNSITVPFANEENEHAGDSVQVVDTDDINLMGQELPASVGIEGCTSLDRASRVGNVFLAEQLEGGVWRFTSTHRAMHLRVGHLVGVSNETHGLDRVVMRAQSILPRQNSETCALEVSEHLDAWYGDDYRPVTGNASTGARRDRLARASFRWAPYQVQPAVGDPLFARSEWTFGVWLVYDSLRNGAPQPYVLVAGKKPVNEPQHLRPPVLETQGTTADSGGAIPGDGTVLYIAVAGRLDGKPGPMSNPCQVVIAQSGSDNTATAAVKFWDPDNDGYFVFAGWDALRLTAVNDAGFSGSPASVTITAVPEATWGAPDTECDKTLIVPTVVQHGGVFAQVLSAVAAGEVEIAGAGWATNEWVGYDCMVLSKADGSALGLLVYRVTANDADTLTVTPDPNAAGVDAGDVLLMLSKPVVTDFVLTDAQWENSLSNSGLGLTPGQEIGRVARFFAGPGRYHKYPVLDNDETSVTVRGPWVVEPTSDSRYVIEDASKLPEAVDATPIGNDDPQAEMVLPVPVRNYRGVTLLLEAITQDGGGARSVRNAVRLLYVPGVVGESAGAADGYFTITPVGGDCVVDLANGLNQRIVLDGTALTVLNPVFTDGVIEPGTWFVLYVDQDATGGHDAPAFDTEFTSEVGAVVLDGTGSTRSVYQLTRHAALWGLDADVKTGGAIA